MFSIVAGSHEKLLYGLRPDFTLDAPQSKLKPLFTFPAHMSCMKALDGSRGGKWLATGSADEIISRYGTFDCATRSGGSSITTVRARATGTTKTGQAVHRSRVRVGFITYLVFPTRSHLVSVPEDGLIYLFHARERAVLRTLKGHRGRVNCVAVCPSSKALSVGKDRRLRM